MPKYTVNKAAFSAWSPTMAYWLGFLFADGCAFTRLRPTDGQEYLLQVKLRRSDEQHIRDFAHWLNYTGPVKYPTADAAAICIYCKALVTSIVALGMHYNKTYAGVSVPPMPAACILPFAQGAFDGNGTVSIDANGAKVALSGPEGLPSWFRAQVATHVDAARCGSMSVRGPMEDAAWHGNKQVPPILRWLASNTEVPRLDRVKKKCDATLEVYYS